MTKEETEQDINNGAQEWDLGSYERQRGSLKETRELKLGEFCEDSNLTNIFFYRDPVHLLSVYDEGIREGKFKLHPWQIKTMLEFAKPTKVMIENNPVLYRHLTPPREKTIHRLSVRANNGSGKSQYTIAPCAIWLAMTQYRSRCVITSSSGVQLDRQTGRALKDLCIAINEFHGEMIWKINYREITFLPTKSTIELFATDDEGRAEGYHPHWPNGCLAIFVDEAKSVSEKIFQALVRCNGTSHRLDVSSPGQASGHFYEVCGENECAPGVFHQVGKWRSIRVTYRECPHISLDEIEEAKERFGETSALFRSTAEALFTNIHDTVIIPEFSYNKCVNAGVVEVLFCDDYAGVDLSGGGDENVWSRWQGNAERDLDPFRFDDTTDTTEYLKAKIGGCNINPANVNVDDGHVGKAIIDNLWKAGYNVNRVRMKAKASDSDTFASIGVELYYKVRRYIELQQIIFLPDELRKKQLTNRFYLIQQSSGKLILEPKEIARVKGRKSPDRADATVLAFTQHDVPLFRSRLAPKVEKPKADILNNALMAKLSRSHYNTDYERMAEGLPPRSEAEEEILYHGIA